MPSKIKLLYVTNQICGAAGLERVLSIKARLLAEAYNYEVHIITLNQGNTELFYDFGTNIKFHDLSLSGPPIKYIRQYIKQFKSKVYSIEPDVISVCDDGLKAFFLPFILNKPCPMVYERHVSKEIENTADKFNLLKWIKKEVTYRLMYLGGKQYNKFVVLTKGNLKEWPLKNLKVISNPLSFSKDVTKSPLDKKIVLAVGRQDFQKGYDRLLDAWREVIKTNPLWELHIYGKKDYTLHLDTLSENYNIGKSVHFFDPIKNISDAYQNASIYVMSSRYEGFGMVLIEAMIHGLPCVSFNCPHGPSDIIDHNKNGLLVENGNIKSLAQSITKLMNNVNTRKQMGSEAIDKALVFSPEIILEQWHKLFKSLIP